MSERTAREWQGTEIAVVGMAGRFPGARDLDEYWRLLRDGVEAVRRLGPDELSALGVDPALLDDPTWVPAVSQLDGYADFDADFFGVNPREAESMDPQHRVFLELAWQALEDAGHAPRGADARVGVFAGATLSTYLLFNLAKSSRTLATVDPLQLIVGNAGDSLATRVSYKLGLTGPSHAVQSACSTSLVAVHLACQSLLGEECDLALAGGVSVNVAQGAGYRYVQDSILSPDGRCRPFDADAQGTLFGSGAGVVVLRRLEDALADGDPVRAVILGSAVNNDGSAKVGFTAPSVEGQAAVVTEALAVSGIDASEVSYVECHGTGTALGDPVEVQALTRAYRSFTDRTGFCAIGSVKSNFGHLDIAAGVAGLIKTVLAMEHGLVPPTLHFRRPNPKIDFAVSPFRVAAEAADWPRDGHPRRAGVSSFGLGGTNAHLVIEEAPERPAAAGAAREWQLLALSARTPAALEAATAGLADHLEHRPELPLPDVAWTLQAGRARFEHRRVAVCRSAEEAVACLRSVDPAHVATGGPAAGARPAMVFLFPGQGAQHPGMARGLYRDEPAFRAAIDRCAEIAAPALGFDLRRGIDADPGDPEAAEALTRQPVGQAALFAVEHSLASLWRSWGVEPTALFGHSVGEYAAASVAGVFSLEDAMAAVVERGRLMAATEAGAMLSVSLPEEEVVPMLSGGLTLAAENAPAAVVVSGPEAAIETLAGELAARGVEHRTLRVSVGAHSTLMEPARGPLEAFLAGVRRDEPRIPLISDLTGEWMSPEEATDPGHWGRQLVAPVRFSRGLRRLLERPERAFLEVGPGRTLTALASLHPEAAGRTAVTSLPHPKDETPASAHLLSALGRLWLAGVEPSWEVHRDGRPRRRVSLPGYPFQRRRFWVEPDAAGAASPLPAAALPIAAAPPPSVDAVASPDGTAPARPGFVAPQGEVERAVARIWEELLGVSPVGVDDDFFALGGHSLLATQVASRLRELFRIELSVEAVLGGPTVAEMARAVEAARDGGEAPAGEGAGGGAIRPRAVPADGREDRATLSFSQERMWFLERLEGEAGGSSAYGLSYAVAMSGPLDPPAFAAALGEVRRRHQALRTTFAEEDGRPVQVVGPACGLPLPVVDLGRLPASRRPEALRRLLAAERHRLFDLGRGPLVRGLLARLAGEEHVCALSMHHIVSDGWSMGIVVREVAALYGAFTRGEPSPLAPLPIQYADYAEWQRRRLQGEVLERHVAYWSERLADLPAPLELPADRPRSAAGGFELRAAELDLPPELDERLEEVARESGATPFMTLLAAFLALLHRYTGETDLVVGAPIANRNRAEVEGLIGFFLNTLVLRTRVDPGAGFAELLAAVRRTALGAYDHQDVPLEALLQAAGGDRRAGMDSLFRVMFLLQNVPRPRLEAAGLTLRELPAEEDAARLGTTIFDVTLTVDRAGEGLSASLSYDAGRFDPATAERLLHHYRALLTAALAEPDRPLEELPLVAEEERGRLLAWGTGATPTAPEVSFLDAFRARARTAPDDPAVVAIGGGALTYRELDLRSAGLAARLVGLGVGPETRVGLAVERSPELLVALLGVLRAGGAYVPLDPKAPPERTAFILEDAGAPVVIASPGLASRLTAAGREVVMVGAEDGVPAGIDLPAPAANPPAPPPESAAYLIYTSGSTGAPKGVVVSRRSLDRFTAAAREAYDVGPGDRVLQFASLGFDTSAEEIFPALASGATLVLRDEEMLRSPEAFLAACRESGITVLDLPTAYFHELMAGLAGAPDTRIGAPLRLIILGGERVIPERLAAVAPALDPGVRLLNTYGPTEATVVATLSEPLAEDGDGPASGREVPIGRPLPGARAFVADRRLDLAPVGVPGELVLGGAGVARGYLGRPGSTAERFVPDPFAAATGGEEGARLYRTGDRTRWLPAGTLEFLGRFDHQVKVRGFRVELGEIEACLAGHPAVRDAVVAAREAAPGDFRLVAYVVVGAGGSAAPPDPPLAAFAEERLPAYMVPSAFVELPELPHTPSGKVDRGALAALDVGPAAGRRGGHAPYRAPETAAEEAVARIFAEVLGGGAPGAPEALEVGADDDFFELGGHSLLLPQVLHRVRAAFEVDVPLRTLYEESTVAGLALAIEELVLEDLERLEAAQ